ncbi:MAG: hypothetical protein GY856_46335, partial [bacterium]|nr:hypothetical protein [bacterium]
VPLTGTRFTAGPFPLTRCPAEFLLTATSSDGRTTSVVHRVDCDLRPPRILVELPVAPRVNASPVRVRGRAVDPHLSEVLVAGRPVELAGDRFEARVPLTEGEQTIEIVARDRFGHESRRQLALTLDMTAPDIRITADGVPLAGGETFGGAVRPQVPPEGDGEQLRIRLNGQPWQPGDTISDEGRYVLQVEAADAAGNRIRREVRSEIDRTPPRVSFSKRAARGLSASEMMVEGTAEGASEVTVNGVTATLQGDRFSAGPFALESGSQRFTATAVDAAGNRNSRDFEIKNDSTAPVITITSPADGAVVDTTPITVTGTTVDADLATVRIGTVDGTVDGTSFTIAGVELIEGENVLAVIAGDTFENESTTLLTVVLDLSPPAIAVTVDGKPLIHESVFPGPVAPVITVTDAIDPNVEAVAELDDLAWTSESSIEDPGWHKLSVTATDAAGNSAAVLLGFEIEAGPPVFESLTPAAGAVVAASSVTLQGVVSGAVEVTVAGESVALVGEEFLKTLTLTDEGDNVFPLMAKSAGGQWSAPLEYRIVLDTSAPELTIAEPTDGELRADRNLTVSGTASDPHLSVVQVNRRDVTLVDSSYTVTNIALAEGPNTIRARAEDTAGNAVEVERTVELDTRAPEVEIWDPEHGTVVPGPTLKISGRALDPHLDRIEIDGMTAQLVGDSWEISVPLSEGENGIMVEAFDTLGNRGEATVNVARASEVPEIRIEEPAAGLVTQAEVIVVSGTVSGCAIPEGEAVEICPTVTVNGDEATVTGGSFVATAVESWSTRKRKHLANPSAGKRARAGRRPGHPTTQATNASSPVP